MTVKYHISKKTQQPAICKAVKEPCRLGEHYASESEALVKAEETLSKEFDMSKPLKRFNSKNLIWAEETNIARTLELYEENKALNSKLTKEEAHALRFYSFTGSSEMNRLLKGIPRDYDGDANLIQQHVKLLDGIFEKYEERKTRQLYRYLIVPKGMTQSEFVQSLGNNSTFEDKGFMSTTEDLSFIRAYAHKHNTKKFVVLSIKTDRGLSLQNNKEEKEGVLQSFEKERLLPRNMKFEITNSTKTTLSVDPTRENLLKQFAGWRWRDWASADKEINSINKKSFPIIELEEIQ